VQSFAGPAQVSTTTQQQTYVLGQSVDPASIIGFQYPSLAQPIQQGGGAVESLTLDKWNSSFPLPGKHRHRVRASDFALSRDVAPPESLTLDKWLAQPHEPIRRARRLAIYGVNCAIAKEVIETMEWSIQSALPRRQRHGLKDYSYGVFTTGAGPAPTTPALFIQGQSVDPQTVRGFQFDGLSFPLRSLSEVITVDKWLTDLSVRFARKLFVDSRSALPQLISEQITLDKWLTTLPTRSTQREARQYYAADVNPFAVAEQLTIDKWLGRVSARFNQRTSRQDHIADVRPFVPIEVITLDKWYSQSALPQRRKGSLRADRADLLLTEYLTLDKWNNQTPDLRRVVKAREGLFVIASQIENLTLDKWLARTPESRRAIRTREGLFVLPSQAAETLTLDKWNVQGVGVSRRRRVFIDPQTAYVKVAPFGDLITLDKWLSYQPTQFPRRKQTEGAFRLYVIPILTIPPTSLPALWRNEATISLLAADLQSIGVRAQDVQSISVMAVSLAEADLITGNSALVSVTTKDEQSITILYEDVRTI